MARKARFGVVQFPGSCDEQDALGACQRVGEARLLWHTQRRIRGIDVVVLPGGFSFGDYLRAGAIASSSAIMFAVRRFADAGGLVLGICNGFQVLAEAHMVPGALLVNWPERPNPAVGPRRFVCRDIALRVITAQTPLTAHCMHREVLSVPIKHGQGRYVVHERERREMARNGQILFRYANGTNPNGSMDNIAGVCNEGKNVFGLMPHPEHAVDPLVGPSTDGLKLFTSLADHAV